MKAKTRGPPSPLSSENKRGEEKEEREEVRRSERGRGVRERERDERRGVERERERGKRESKMESNWEQRTARQAAGFKTDLTRIWPKPGAGFWESRHT